MEIQPSIRYAVAALGAAVAGIGDMVVAQESAVSKYAKVNPDAPTELELFSFLIGTWEGHGRTQLEDGSFAEYELTWIGRHALDGMAIVDELHAPLPDGSPALGITLRYFDPASNGWIIEFLNVNGSFIRRQVNSRFGAVDVEGNTIAVTSVDGQSMSREFYTRSDHDRFSYAMELSPDGGTTWSRAPFEFQFERASEDED